MDVTGLNDFTISIVIVVLMHVGVSCRPTVFGTMNK